MSMVAGRVLIIPKGIYNPYITYYMLDMVRTNNGTYICKKTSLGNTPYDGSDYWQLVVNGTSTTFTGTKMEWQSMSDESKAMYTTVIIIDD